MSRIVFVLALVLTIATGGRARAQEYYREPTGRDMVIAQNVGPRFSLAPGVFLPTDGGHVGFSIAGDYRHGFELGHTILAPGARLAGFFPSDFVALTAMGTARLTVPVGPVGPYLMGGVGPGYVSEPSKVGLALLGGGGLMVYIGTSFGIGAEASYLTITGTNLHALFIGPALMLGF
jgi:hypothetical protein